MTPAATTTAGDLRDRVRFEQRAEQDDGAGNTGRTGDWTPEFSRAAQIRPLKGGEEVIGARLTGVQPALVIVRFDSQTSAVTTDWRIVEERSGAIYNIKTAADMERRRAWMTFTAVAGEPA